jgi:hemerythrin
METLIWSPQMSLGLPAMNDVSKTFVEELSSLMTAPDHEFGENLPKLIARMEHDFRREEMMMEEIDFPTLRTHREEHARALGTLHHVVPKVMQGDYALARIAIELLPQWLLFHLLKMDTALLAALSAAGLQPRLPLMTIPRMDLALHPGNLQC